MNILISFSDCERGYSGLVTTDSSTFGICSCFLLVFLKKLFTVFVGDFLVSEFVAIVEGEDEEFRLIMTFFVGMAEMRSCCGKTDCSILESDNIIVRERREKKLKSEVA